MNWIDFEYLCLEFDHRRRLLLVLSLALYFLKLPVRRRRHLEQ